jgi:hypothetical protein
VLVRKPRRAALKTELLPRKELLPPAKGAADENNDDAFGECRTRPYNDGDNIADLVQLAAIRLHIMARLQASGN